MRKHNRILYVMWNRKLKGLEVDVQVDELIVRGGNFKISLRSREIEVQGNIKSYGDYVVGRKKYCYIDFNGPLTLLDIPRVDLRNQDMEIISNFELRVTDIEVSKYLTIVTPGNFLYNYVILSNNSLGVELSSRRNVFYEQIRDGVIVYMM